MNLVEGLLGGDDPELSAEVRDEEVGGLHLEANGVLRHLVSGDPMPLVDAILPLEGKIGGSLNDGCHAVGYRI